MRLGAFALLTLLSMPALAQDAAQLDNVVQAHAAEKRFMGAVLVARDGQLLLNKGYGAANLEWAVPNSPMTKFRLGSLTKQFTAASILLLEERGKLNLDDVVKVHVPDAPAAWDAITIHHLLTHTSGIPNFTAFPNYGALRATPTTTHDLIGRFRDKPLDFPAGDRMSYSNSGYVLLGHIVERVSGVSYAQFVQNNLFDPIGMRDSGYDSNTAIIERRAAGYANGPSGPVNGGFLHMSIPHGAGALYSTTEDLLRWHQALHGGRVLSPASLTKMLTPFKNNYALGVVARSEKGVTTIEHTGGIDGFNTYLAYDPDRKLTVAVLGNLSGPIPAQIGRQLLTLARGGAQ